MNSEKVGEGAEGRRGLAEASKDGEYNLRGVTLDMAHPYLQRFLEMVCR